MADPAPLPPLLATLVRAAKQYRCAFDAARIDAADILALASAWEELAGRAAQLQGALL